MELSDINFSFNKAEDQSNLFTPNHCRYNIKLSVNGCDPFFTDYQCNKSYIPTIEDVIECIINDSIAYESTSDILDFMYAYGYTDKDACRKAYDACYDAYMWFQTEWSNDDFCSIYNELGL